jgi:hypothetical protein
LNVGTDEADAQLELKHAIAQGNSEAQRAANEKLVRVPICILALFLINAIEYSATDRMIKGYEPS